MGIAAEAAAWTAFGVASLALFVALAQVLQQYISTATGMRTCDSLVWGSMPGRSGRRKWVWHQFRFRVVFEMPNLFIPWPPYAINAEGGILEPAPHMLVSFAAFGDECLPQLTLVKAVKSNNAKDTHAGTDEVIRERTVELAAIDWWLYHAAITLAIMSEEANSLGDTPSILQSFEREFATEVSRVARNQWSPRNLDETLILSERLLVAVSQISSSRATQYFVWVAILRATKMMQCVMMGVYARPALELSQIDVLGYMA